MSYSCEIREQSLQPVLAIRLKTAVQKLPQVLGQAYGAIAQYLGALGEQPQGPPYVAYYNMDMANLDVEIGFPTAKPLPGKGDIHASEIAGGKVATCLHIGPYDQIGLAYAALTQWTKAQGHEATGVAYEFYLNDPAQTSPQELRTQIVFPLQ